MSRTRSSRWALAAALLGGLSPAPLAAQDFYAGRTIDFVIGADVGGGYDVYARAIARRLPRYIAGAPTVVVKNMPGAGSAVAAAQLYTIAPKDGSTIGALMPGAILDRVLSDGGKANYDPSKFIYLASADSGTRVCLTYQNAKAKTFAEALAQPVIMGASAAGAATRDYPLMVAKATGAKFNVVAGYKGSSDILLAMERGEVNGMCGLDWNSLRSTKPDWLRDGKINLILQTALEPHPDLARMGVPEIWPFIKNETDRKAVQLVVSQQVFLRSYIAPPGVPADRVATLRAAFASTLADQEFLADAQKMKIDVNPLPGEKVQAVVDMLYATPKDVVARAKELIAP
ncbi:MAG: hypothetical protein JWN93_3280 [Hyphomicrobiales bacterium]|nr:hypothetical protein [Hyphomicrobiales bacterium]